MAQGHWHQLTVEGAGKDAVYSLGPPQGMLQARVPIYGKLRFKNKTGQDAEKGVNVGDEWTYRTFIEGGNQAAAIWTFEGITEEKFPDGIPLEMTIEVFRTHKGDLEKGIPGSLWIRNPQSGKKVEVRIFEAKKFATDLQFIPRELNQKGRKLDLFRDLVSDDGRLEVWLQCLQVRQYFGMAQADLYLRVRPDVPFWWNFVKGYLGIWLQMVLVIGIGVMFSTFLSCAGGPDCHARLAGGRPLPGLHARGGLGEDHRRRPIRVGHPHPQPTEPNLATAAGVADHLRPDGRSRRGNRAVGDLLAAAGVRPL